MEQIPIVSSAYCDENNAYIAYGADAILSFEIIVSWNTFCNEPFMPNVPYLIKVNYIIFQSLNSSEKSMFIVRQDPRKRVIANKEQLLNKVTD